MKYYLTKHAIERYTQRINGLNLNNQELVKEILGKLYKGKDITNKIYEDCPRYILHLYERYNELGQTIIESENIIFICRKRPSTNLYDVITCYNNSNHLKQWKETVLSRTEIFLKIKLIKNKLKK